MEGAFRTVPSVLGAKATPLQTRLPRNDFCRDFPFRIPNPDLFPETTFNTMSDTSIVWFRQDLRLADNPALVAAVSSSHRVLCVYIDSPQEEEPWPPGGAAKWWLGHSLAALAQSLESKGGRLDCFRGASGATLSQLAKQTNASAVYWNRRYEPRAIARDTQIKKDLTAQGLAVESFNGSLLLEPPEVRNKQGKPFQVFTPFWRAFYEALQPTPLLTTPRKIPCPPEPGKSVKLSRLGYLPKIPWDAGLKEMWVPGEEGAWERIEQWIMLAPKYDGLRDQTDRDGTSRLSPYLHFGEISPRQIWHKILQKFRIQPGAPLPEGLKVYAKELVWREFAYHLLFHFPQTPLEPLRAQYAEFPWNSDRSLLRAWQRGLTGYPMVDAGMRQLWHTGWMHNRVRMIVASFLVKHLLLPWQDGARWFWDTLVDADLASNTLNWQWSAGCGADAAPYFRIFNPVSQGEKFDPFGDYVRKWVPELAKLDVPWIHKPWEAPPFALQAAKVELGVNYPLPVVDHVKARNRALEALKSLRE